MANDVKPIAGWMAPSICRPHGSASSHAPRTAHVKDAAADRLEMLVHGRLRGKGVENCDPVKSGYITPQSRVEELMLKAKAFDAKLKRVAGDASIPKHKKVVLMSVIERQLCEVVEEIDSIQRDLCAGEE